MDGTLEFPLASPPSPGETIAIAPGIWWLRMPLPFALDHINLWLLEDGPQWTIVDCGYTSDEAKAAWEKIFAERLGDRRVTRIIATHYHPDHMGLAHWLVERWQAPLWTSDKEWLCAQLFSREDGPDLTAIRTGFAREAGLEAAASEVFALRHRHYRRGVPAVPLTYHRIGDGTAIEIGGRRWQVAVGEGHAPEHACLYCAEARVLIAGDQILPKISPNISVQAHEPDGDPLARYLASLAKLGRMIASDTLVLPSHNLPFYGIAQRISELGAHHRARCAEVLAACTRPMSAAELIPVLFRRRLDAHQTGFALGEALAHLHYLMAKGEIERALGPDGVARFRRGARALAVAD
jgi:glyoxylase-like metal-dependent hydrolase (beta-lactamase superfamily II)